MKNAICKNCGEQIRYHVKKMSGGAHGWHEVLSCADSEYRFEPSGLCAVPVEFVDAVRKWHKLRAAGEDDWDAGEDVATMLSSLDGKDGK